MIGGLVGLFFGWMQCENLQQTDPFFNGKDLLKLMGRYMFRGAFLGFLCRSAYALAPLWLAYIKTAREKREAERLKDEELELRQTEKKRRDAANKQHDAASRADRMTARKHLVDFYNAHKEFLATTFPPALMEAFMVCEMPNNLPPDQLWLVCQKKIAEFQPIIIQERAKRKKEYERLKKGNVRLKLINADIRACQEKIAHVSKSGLDPEFIEDETHGLQMRIRQLEEQKELLSTLSDRGNV